MAYVNDAQWYISETPDGLLLHQDQPSGTLVLPHELFEDLVAMKWARLDEQERERITARAAERHGGQLGCAALREQLGLTSVLGRAVREAMEQEVQS